MSSYLDHLRNGADKVDKKLKNASPAKVIAGTVVGVFALQKLRNYFADKSLREAAGDWALYLPMIRAEYRKEFEKNMMDSRAKVIQKYASYGTPITEIPEHGWTADSIRSLINDLAEKTNKPLENLNMSGTIYSNSLRNGDSKHSGFVTINKLPEGAAPGEMRKRELKTAADLNALSLELSDLYTATFKQSYLWNSLHLNEFGIGDYLTYQVINMVASVFGGTVGKVMGFCTSGGTESLMTAMRCYKNWGVRNRGHKPGEGVVICADSIHAAVMKAGIAYNLEVVCVPANQDGTIRVKTFKEALNKYGKRVICIVGSGPSYPCGVVDPIKDLGQLALDYGIGLHVDCCLGGFIINFLQQHNSDFLAIPGVTSLSADTHKNGWAPKGSSVLLTNPTRDAVMNEINLAYYSLYSIPGWSGGVYGTPKDNGSASCTHTLHAFVAMLAIGKSGYTQIAQGIFDTCNQMAQIVDQCPPLKMVTAPEVNVVAFHIDPSVQWGKGAIYAFAHMMEQRGFVLSALKAHMVHFCVTGRLAFNPDAMKCFADACKICMEELKEVNAAVCRGEKAFPGDAGIYGQLEAAMEPGAASDISTAQYVQNWLLGQKGAEDAVRAYFMGIMGYGQKE
mmetsp:Transcript_38218/g.75225  ORF Transcript_38218/g.75225 Transcript_38218/m.75225 type:complete len:621 (-) Transcript_38218:80-1942(-)|eukprot:CAMPEP_0175091176 /NCGR_PEP_ID=MMETSP0086_2-20121207/1756_1 /TAXON_ID=136419 /ORGANISM="Unknown Unknown, Strain D1" /LENGTH=620 /DNA_ID=CAMNT_0016363887 /DNA_START=31 /DNA_END=1893 /DNA_ORIENTATION=-